MPLPTTASDLNGSITMLAELDDTELSLLGFVVAAPLPTAGADEEVYWAGNYWAARPLPLAEVAPAPAAAPALAPQGDAPEAQA